MGERHEHLVCHELVSHAEIFCVGNGIVFAVASYIRPVRSGIGADPSAEQNLQEQYRADCIFHLLRNLSAHACMVCRLFLYPPDHIRILCSADYIFSDCDIVFSDTVQLNDGKNPACNNDCCGIILYLL